MNKYKVKIAHVFAEIIDVEAANEEDARLKTAALLKDESRESDPFYELTIPIDQWPVISEEDLNKLIEQEEKESGNIITPNIITP